MSKVITKCTNAVGAYKKFFFFDDMLFSHDYLFDLQVFLPFVKKNKSTCSKYVIIIFTELWFFSYVWMDEDVSKTLYVSALHTVPSLCAGD